MFADTSLLRAIFRSVTLITIKTLKETVNIIDYHKREKCGVCKLSEVFKIGKTQAAEIVKKRRVN
jgi:hypothetical protein